MLNHESNKRLRERLKIAFYKSPNDLAKISSIESKIGYLMLDASDIYERISDAPFQSILINTCIELMLRRESFDEAANNFASESYKDKDDYTEEIMREIISKGNKRVAICPACGCYFKYDESDIRATFRDIELYKVKNFYVECPECDGVIPLWKENKTSIL